MIESRAVLTHIRIPASKRATERLLLTESLETYLELSFPSFFLGFRLLPVSICPKHRDPTSPTRPLPPDLPRANVFRGNKRLGKLGMFELVPGT